MASKKRPQGYAPFLELYLRRKSEGGDVLAPARFQGPVDARARTSCLVLVHGFNNSEVEAAEAYFGYRTRQTELTGATRDYFDRYFGDAFWPGDADWGRFDFADFLVYPAAVKKAATAARELVQLLWSMPNLERVSFVGHSLGCRVVMEALQRLQERALPVVDAVCLMAAAVPAEMLEPRGRYHSLMQRLQVIGTRMYVLHSTRDPVLHRAFPPGQKLAGEGSNRALGRVGPNASMPGFGATLTDSVASGATHGDYWGQQKNRASDEATEKSGIFLRLGEPPRSLGTARGLSAPSSGVEARALGSSRTAFG